MQAWLSSPIAGRPSGDMSRPTSTVSPVPPQWQKQASVRSNKFKDWSFNFAAIPDSASRLGHLLAKLVGGKLGNVAMVTVTYDDGDADDEKPTRRTQTQGT